MPKPPTPVSSLTDEQREIILARIEKLKKIRQVSRTNLLWFCNNILGYKDVCQEVHGEMIAALQKFKGGKEKFTSTGDLDYTPACDLWELEGSRSTLILFPRGHLKTTVITLAHTIQWIINYPDVRILLSTATGDQARKMLLEIKSHFQFNERFRTIFADFCPSARAAKDWGSQEEFTVPNRKKHRKEPTLSTCSVGKVIAGSHYEVIKNSDLVDKENVKTPNQIADVISHFQYLDPLLERSKIAPHHGWKDVEGTRYDFGDLYGKLIDSKSYSVTLRPRDDEETVWPERFPPEELKRIEKETGAYQYSCQMRNKPIPPEGGLCDPSEIVFVPRPVLAGIVPRLRLHCTVDLHGLEPAKNDNDFTVLNVHGFDADGRLYIVDVRRGRFTPSIFVWHWFDIMNRYPRLVDFKVEKVILWAALKATLQAEMQKRQKFACIVEIKRDTHTSKQQRIRGLQPWFKSGRIRFADDLVPKSDILLEIMQFPSQSSGVHDDVLDTCADALQNEEGGTNVDVIPDYAEDPLARFGKERPRDRFMGFGENGVQQWLYGTEGDEREVRSVTGVL